VNDIPKNSGLEEVAFETLASSEHLGTLGRGVLDVFFGFVDRGSLDERAVGRALLETIPDLELLNLGSELFGKLLIDTWRLSFNTSRWMFFRKIILPDWT
jgi:hypothetical protein